MKNLLIIIFTLIAFKSFAQMPPTNTVGDWQWSSNYATGWDKQNYMSYYSNTILYVHEDSFSNVISVGITTKHTILKNLNGLHTGYDSIYPSDKIGQMGGIITKYDCAGTVLWSHLIGVKKSFSSAGRLYMADALTDEGGNTYLYICCESADFLDTVWFGNKVLAMPYNTYSPGDRNIMAKIDANGNIVWAKDFQDDFLINSYSLCPFQNNQFISSRCTGTDMYDIGKGAHMLSLLNDTIHFFGRIDSSLILFPNIASNRPTCEWPAATLQELA
jgi:hypothetical protein